MQDRRPDWASSKITRILPASKAPQETATTHYIMG